MPTPPAAFTLPSPKSLRHLLLGLLFLGFALADHGPRPSQLGGTRLCLDGASVESAVWREGGRRDEALERRLGEGLRAETAAVLARLEVAFDERSSCAGRPDYARLQLQATYLDPRTYLNFPERSYSYAVVLQVGDHEEMLELEPEEVLSSPLHLLFTSALHSEADGPLEDQLFGAGQELIRALAWAWWDDNAERYAGSRSYLPQLIGSGLAVIAAALVLLTRRRRGRHGSYTRGHG